MKANYQIVTEGKIAKVFAIVCGIPTNVNNTVILKNVVEDNKAVFQGVENIDLTGGDQVRSIEGYLMAV